MLRAIVDCERTEARDDASIVLVLCLDRTILPAVHPTPVLSPFEMHLLLACSIVNLPMKSIVAFTLSEPVDSSPFRCLKRPLG